MKNKLVLTLLTIALATSVVKAQEAAAGAAVGAVAGAAIGANNHNPVAGAVTGALVGGLIGNAIEANKQPQPQVIVVQTPPSPPAPVVVQAPTTPPPPVVMAPVVVQSPVNYVWGPLNRHGYPEYVYVQVWNGREWVTTYYAYNQFLVWYGRYYGRPFREVEFRHHWHR